MNLQLPSVAGEKSCCGCYACVDICPVNALSPILDKEGFLSVNIDNKKCIKCKKCIKACPVISLKQPQNNRNSALYVAWTNNETIRKQGATSGFFGSLAQFFLQNDNIVVGAVQDGFTTRHVICTEASDLPRLQGSKYQASHLEGIYKRVLELIESNKKILFSGLPCQIAALKCYLGSKASSENLYTIDLICGGVPSYSLASLYQAHNPDVTGIKSFRNKENGWKPLGFRYNLQVIKKDGSIEYRGDKNFLIRGFSSHLFIRRSCFHCKFATAHHCSDITIGDFWGNKHYPEQHANGLSAVIIHTERGEELIKKQSNIIMHPTDWLPFFEYNPRYWNRLSIICPSVIERAISSLLLRLSLKKKHDYLRGLLNIVDFLLKIRFILFSRLVNRCNRNIVQKEWIDYK